jgi:flagellar biosynthesis chaperone FliJ
MQVSATLDKVTTSALSPLNATDRAAVIKAVSADDSGRKVPVSRQARQIQVLSKWAQAADVSKQLSQTDQTERSIRQAYQALENLKRQLNSPAYSKLSAEQQQMAQQQLQQLEQKLQKPAAGINADLTLAGPGPAPVKASLSHSIDLLTERRQTEQVQILLGRSGGAVSLVLEAGQTAEQNLHTMQQAFSRQQISVGINQQQQLYFSAEARDARKLQEPWLITGQGVRVAAGNPVSVKLQPADSGLAQLSKAAATADNVQAYQQQIQQAQQQLKDALVKVQAQRAALQAQLAAIQQSQGSNAELNALSEQLQLGMQGGSKSAVSVVMSQANITRSLVEFGLG